MQAIMLCRVLSAAPVLAGELPAQSRVLVRCAQLITMSTT